MPDSTHPANDSDLRSTISCPNCGHQKTETMPIDFCVYYYECTGCGSLLKTKPGECCVFCSYGTVECPPKKAGECGC